MADLTSRERIDQYLMRMGFVHSRRVARELIERRRVRVNGRIPRKGDLVSPGDQIEVEAVAPEPALIADHTVSIDVLYSDPAMLVVNKPGLMPCHPLEPGERGTLMNGVVARFPETATAGEIAREGGLVHRLDNGTSGALMIVRTRDTHERLRRDLAAGRIERRYQALVVGALKDPQKFDEPIGHRRRNSQKMAGLAAGVRTRGRARPASTRVEPLRRLGCFTLLRVIPRTGSRHQIRVHLADAGHPILNDRLYGAPRCAELPEGRFWLHLAEIEFDSPAAGRVLVTAPLPPELSIFLDASYHGAS
jgi:23S rRNA pseudouridine1911/1915/1917 synthase